MVHRFIAKTFVWGISHKWFYYCNPLSYLANYLFILSSCRCVTLQISIVMTFFLLLGYDYFCLGPHYLTPKVIQWSTISCYVWNRVDYNESTVPWYQTKLSLVSKLAICWLYPLLGGAKNPTSKNLILNCIWSLGKYGILFHCRYSQIHSVE